MNPNKVVLGSAVAVFTLLPAAVPTTTLADAPPTYSTPTAAQLADLPPAEIALLNSSTAKAIVMDPTTGGIVSVLPTTATGQAAPEISHHSGCNTGDGCYRTNNGNNVDQGFSGGAGTVNGTWANRSGYSAGNWTVSACWSGGCGIKIGPGSSLSLTSDVTGTSFTIH